MTTAINLAGLPADCVGLKLFRINSREELIACEGVMFKGGRGAVDTVLRRAAIAGRVEVGGAVKDHFADTLKADGSWEETIALDADSYRSLKTKWMPCKVERDPTTPPAAQSEGGAGHE